jgi:nucleotide-binding universal stress UspA family protein
MGLREHRPFSACWIRFAVDPTSVQRLKKDTQVATFFAEFPCMQSPLMSKSTDPSSILVGVELPEPTPLPPALVDLLSSLRVVLVGWYAVPEQTLPAQARDEFEDEAELALESIAQPFEEAGALLDTVLVFSHDRLDTVGRLSREHDCDAVLLAGEMEHLHRLLVPLRGLHNAHYVAPFVADLIQNETTEVSLLHVLEDDETAEKIRETMLRPAAEKMTDWGIDGGLLALETIADDDPDEAIVEAAKHHDAVVIGESEPSVHDILFGTVPETIVQTAHCPVLVVRNPDENLKATQQST